MNRLNRTCNQWQTQIQNDIDYLSPGQELFVQMIETIRGIVDIEQTEIDNTNQFLIAYIGTALAVSGVSSQVASEPVKIIVSNLAPNQFSNISKSQFSSYLSFSFFEIIFHIIIGIILAIPLSVVVSAIVRLIQRHSKT